MSHAPLPNLPGYTDKMTRDANRILDALDRWDDRFATTYSRSRAHERTRFRGVLAIRIPSQIDSERVSPASVTFMVWGRNLSRSGVSFIHPEVLKVRFVDVGLTTNGQLTWFRGEIVRTKKVEDGFWEYGLRFVARSEAAAQAGESRAAVPAGPELEAGASHSVPAPELAPQAQN